MIVLPPRQEEIYLIIKDHRDINLDFIHRRFMAVPKRTLRYDLKRLQEKDLIVKVGVTNRVVYRAKEE